MLSLLKYFFKNIDKNSKSSIGVIIVIAIISYIIGSNMWAIIFVLMGILTLIILKILEDKESNVYKFIIWAMGAVFVIYVFIIFLKVVTDYFSLESNLKKENIFNSIIPQDKQKLNLKGVVKSESGVFIKNAKIEISNYNLTTFANDKGEFTFSKDINIEKGEKENIKVSAEGYENKHRKINLNSKDIEIYLKKKK